MKRTIPDKQPAKPTMEDLLQKLRELDEKELEGATGGLQPPDKCNGTQGCWCH